MNRKHWLHLSTADTEIVSYYWLYNLLSTDFFVIVRLTSSFIQQTLLGGPPCCRSTCRELQSVHSSLKLFYAIILNNKRVYTIQLTYDEAWRRWMEATMLTSLIAMTFRICFVSKSYKKYRIIVG